MEQNKLSEIATRQGILDDHQHMAWTSPFLPRDPGNLSYYFHEWSIIARLIHHLRIPSGACVLDLGCGFGWTSLFMARSGLNVVGVDISPDIIALATERAVLERLSANVRFEVADMEKLPDFGLKFELVLIYDALHHCANDKATLRNAIDALVPGGWLLVGEANVLHHISPPARRTTHESGWLERGFSQRYLRKTIKDLGAETISLWYDPGNLFDARLRSLARIVAGEIGTRFFAFPGRKVWLAARKRSSR